VIGNRILKITAVQNTDALLDQAEELEHFPFGFLLWESSIALATYLVGRPHLTYGRKVLELGAGVGVTGIVAQSLGGAVRQTDHQKGALVLAEQNAEQNGIQGIERFAADWRNWTCTDRFDLILGSDITYERGMHFYLEEIFSANLTPDGVVLLSDPGRPQTLEFASRLELRGWHIEIDTLTVDLAGRGQSDGATDITILALTKRSMT